MMYHITPIKTGRAPAVGLRRPRGGRPREIDLSVLFGPATRRAAREMGRRVWHAAGGFHLSLVETSKPFSANPGGGAASLVLHGVMISLAVLTLTGAPVPELVGPAMVEDLIFLAVPVTDAGEPAMAAPLAAAEDLPRGDGGGGAVDEALLGPPPAKGFQVLVAPVDIPDVLPTVDLSRAVTDEADFSGRGMAGGIARGVKGGVAVTLEEAARPHATGPIAGSPTGDRAFRESQVETMAVPFADNPMPKYPESLRLAGIQGAVVIQFVIDTTGRVEMASLRVVRSDNEQFTGAVRMVLPHLRYEPARIGDRKVRLFVEQPYDFVVAGR